MFAMCQRAGSPVQNPDRSRAKKTHEGAGQLLHQQNLLRAAPHSKRVPATVGKSFHFITAIRVAAIGLPASLLTKSLSNTELLKASYSD